MTPEQIREVVKITLDELEHRRQYKPVNYAAVLKVVDKQLYKFFNSESGKCGKVGAILRQYSDDPYIDVIYLQYRDRVTIERIAEGMSKDVSTIKRNKKRLIMAIYNQLEVE